MTSFYAHGYTRDGVPALSVEYRRDTSQFTIRCVAGSQEVAIGHLELEDLRAFSTRLALVLVDHAEPATDAVLMTSQALRAHLGDGPQSDTDASRG